MFPLLFANPWGLLGLLGIPVVLAIHFLHRHRKAIPVSTLFLIEIAREPARSGQRWHKLLPSVPMWLQLLLVLLLSLLLARPHLPQGVLRVAVVMDDSASMRAFRDQVAARLTALHQQTQTGRLETQWLVLPSNPTRPRVYAGNDPSSWISRLGEWSPADSWRDPADALRLARDQVGPEGLVVYLTDTPKTDLPGGVALLSVGQPLSNVGIGGVRITEEKDGGARWQAVVVNPSASTSERMWKLEWDGTHASPPDSVTIPAGGIATLEGRLPETASRFVLRLSSDEFTLDDAFPFVRPQPKPLTMSTHGDGMPAWLPERMQRSIPRLTSASPVAADFAVVALAGALPAPSSAGIIVSSAGDRDAEYFRELPTPTNHPLVRGLSWAGLVAKQVPATPPEPSDEVLLWVGEKPLISFRKQPSQAHPDDSARMMPAAGPQLIFHFNPALSNFERLPAGAVLLLRFVESLREAKLATTWAQLEPGQSLRPFLPSSMESEPITESLAMDGNLQPAGTTSAKLRAQDEPGFLRVREGELVLLEGAVAFADARESDFSAAAPADTVAAALATTSRVSSTSGDAPRQWLALLALAGILLLYHYSRSPAAENPPPLSSVVHKPS